MPRLFPGGSNNYLSPGSPAILSFPGSVMTIAAWFKPAAVNNNVTLISKWFGGATQEFILYIDASNHIAAGFAASAFPTGTVACPTGQWQHAAATLSGTNSLVYRDGVQEASAGSATIVGSAATVAVGGSNTEGFNGQLAHGAIWAATLTPAEIRQLAQGVPPYLIRPQSLVAYWPLDDYKVGGASIDASKYINTLSMIGTVGIAPDSTPVVVFIPDRVPAIKRPGIVTRAAIINQTASLGNVARDFPGTTADFLNAGNPAALDITGDYLTLFAWVKPDVLGQREIFGKRNAGGSVLQYELTYVSDKPVILIGNGGGGYEICGGVTSLSTGVWQSVGGVKSGSGANALRVYLNGKLDGVLTSTITIGSTAQNFLIGLMGQDVPSFPFDGSIAHVAIWNAALTSQEMELLARGTNPLWIRPGALKGYWPLNSYPSGIDRSGYANHATMNGSVSVAGSPPAINTGLFGIVAGGQSQLGAAPLTQILASHG